MEKPRLVLLILFIFLVIGSSLAMMSSVIFR